MIMEKNRLFEQEKPSKALAVMALPTIASQIIVLVYNLADTWFIGRTNNPYMVGASALALTVYLAVTALANVFGVGGGSLMVRLIGEKREEDARRVASYTVAAAAISALGFSLLVLIAMDPLLKLLGASSNTLPYAKQYVLTTTVLGGVPTVLAMAMPQLMRNAGFSKEAGVGVGIGSLLNVLLDPLFMFVLLPKGSEVLGAGIATMLSNVISLIYFIFMFLINFIFIIFFNNFITIYNILFYSSYSFCFIFPLTSIISIISNIFIKAIDTFAFRSARASILQAIAIFFEAIRIFAFASPTSFC